MDALDLEVELTLTAAEARVTTLLLRQLVSALVAKDAIDRHEIAGALLRTETQARLADEAETEEGRITNAHSHTAEQTTREWGAYFGLEPSFYALRLDEQRWKDGGSHGPHPFEEQRIAAQME